MPRQITTPDGRTLEIHEGGAPDGPVILAHHGTPASGPSDPSHIADAARRGARLVSVNRPGYAGSTPRPGRSVADVVDDVRAVLDDLGAERCVVTGVSGGGPHALACAALLPDRVAAVATLASVAPYGAEGLDFMAGMGEDNVEEFGAALAGEAQLRATLEPFRDMLAAVTGDQIYEQIASVISGADLEVLTGEYAEGLAAELRNGVSSGIEGWVEDDLAFTKPWGFELSDITVPVLLWQGDQDLMVPPTHGAWLAERIPGVEAHLSAEDGHLTLDARRVPEVHEWLLERL
jgi:pimeloyl-ACP methyl ester carboxylesterase